MEYSAYMPLDNAECEIEWLLSYLAHNNIHPNQSSEFVMDAKLALKTLADAGTNEYITVDDRSRERIDSIIGLTSLARYLHFATQRLDNGWISDYLDALRNKPDILFSSRRNRIPQRDFTWELMSACVLSSFCREIRHAEPDIQGTLNNVRWGVACKVLYSLNPSQQVRQIQIGADQIEKSDSQFGIVLVDVSPLVDHLLYMPIERQEGQMLIFGYRNYSNALKVLKNDIEIISDRLKKAGLCEHVKFGQNKDGSMRKCLGIILSASSKFMVAGVPQLVVHTHKLLSGGIEMVFCNVYHQGLNDIMRHEICVSPSMTIKNHT